MKIMILKKITAPLICSLMMAVGMMAQSKDKSPMPDIRDKNFVARMKQENSPLMSDQWATFVYRGNADDVELIGEMTDWQRKGIKLKSLAGTKVKYYSLPFLSDARIEYKFLVNGEWQLDPLNSNTIDNGVGSLNNYFTMPRYKANDWAIENSLNPKGRVENVGDEFHSGRQLRVYLPPQYESTDERFPTIYFGDGIEYLERATVNTIVDNLIAANRIRPVIIVCLAPLDRMKEYWMNKNYLDFLVNDVVAKVDAKYKTIRSAEGRAIAGASLGGLFSAFAAMNYTEVFGNVLGQSSAFTVNNNQMLAEIENAERKNIKWYLEVGRSEALIDSNRQLKTLLESKAYQINYREVSAGHNWTHWKDFLADGLIYLFPHSKR